MSMESGTRDSALLPEAAPIPPSEVLRRSAPLADAAAYLALLAQSRHDPEGFWMRQARDLCWSREPEALGGPGRFFPGGSLNLCRECLDRHRTEGERRSVLIAADAGGALRRLSRGELGQKVGALAGRLTGWALSPGQRVLLLLPPGEDLVVALLAVWRLGLCAVPCDPAMEPGRRARRIRDAGCAAAVLAEPQPALEPELVPPRALVLPAAGPGGTAPDPVEVSAMSPALVVADATGRLLALPAAGFLVQAKLAYRWLLDGRGGDDIHGFLCPSHHVSLLAGLAGALACGGAAAPLPLPADASGWGAPRALGVRVLLVRAKNLPPAPDAGAPPPSHPGPELVALEGESVAPRIYHWVKGGLFAQDTHVVQVLSRPEAGGFVAGPCPGLIPVRPASVSLPAPGLDLWVVDRAGQPCPVHHGGLLSLRQACPGLPLELQREKPPWVLGVRVRMDADNGLWPMGEWSPPRGPSATSLPELEAVLAAMPGVEQAAVVAYNDAQGILRTAAFVRLASDGPDLDQVRERLRQRLGDASLPDSLQSVAQLPMSRTGKLLRSVLRRVARGEEIPIEELESVADPETLRPLLPQNVRPR